MKSESQPRRFFLGAKKLVPIWNPPDNMNNIFLKARKVRGKLYHPRSAYDPYDKELLKSYLEIKGIVKSFMKCIAELNR